MITIRCYEESDAQSVGRLIADTYGEFKPFFPATGKKEARIWVRSGTPGRRRRRIETPSSRLSGRPSSMWRKTMGRSWAC